MNEVSSSQSSDSSIFLEQLFASFNSNFELVNSNYTSEENFDVTLRVQLPVGDSPSHSCSLWKDEFSKKTKTNWTVRSSIPHPNDFVYRIKYECHHSKQNKSKCQAKANKTNTAKGTTSSYTRYRNKNCESSIDIKIQKDTKSTREKHKHVREGRTATIKVIKYIYRVRINILCKLCFYGKMFQV
jgi:hypothetical protein